ncbi:MAG: hypothetical protein ACJ8GW_10060 [Massilia sp.]
MKSLVLPLLLALGGCAPQVEGAYADAQGTAAFRLAHGNYFRSNPDGSDYKSTRAGRTPLPLAHPYKVDGKLLVVEQNGAQRAEFEILADGRLKLSDGQQALIFVRK